MKKIFFFAVVLLFAPYLSAQTPNRTVNFAPVIQGVQNYASLTSALTGTTSGMTIWVAAGIYKENEITIPAGVTIIGGFPANATFLSQRKYPGTATNAQLSILDGSYTHRVATVHGTLDGFVITKGYVYDASNNQSQPLTGNGGGVLIDGGIVQNCILHNNIAAKLASSPGTIPGTFVASIGDIYCTDGTLLRPLYTLNSSGNIVATLSGGIPSGKIVQGIVFYVDTSPTSGHFLIMGKVSSNQLQPWFNSTPMYDFPLANITTLANAMADFNGKTNSNSLNTQFNAWHATNPTNWWYEGWDNDNPIPYTLNYNSPSETSGDWYLPAGGEIYKIWEVYPQMDACARDILNWISGTGSTMFTKGPYWSSSEYDANNVWALHTESYPWSNWGLQISNKTGGGYTIPIASKALTVR